MAWKLASLIIVSLLVLAACSSSGGGRDTQSGRGTDAEATPTTAAEEGPPTGSPESRASRTGGSADRLTGGSLVRLGADPPTLDPHLTTDATSATYIVEVFGGLVTIGPDLNVVEDLAQRYDVSPDGRTYTFHLRDGIRFHSGKPVTARDFKWSFERVADPLTASPVVDEYLGDIVGVKERLRGQATEVSGIRVIDEQTLEITIDAPKSYFLAKLTYPTGFVLDQENVESSSRWFLGPNGTGPFKLTEYVPGESLILTGNDNYHLGAPFLNEVRFILSGGTGMLMYENDEIDITGVGLADLERVQDPSNPLNEDLVQAPPAFSTSYIGMNVSQPPFDDRKVRQALNYAIDRESIAKIALANLVVPAKGILPPEFPGYSPDVKGYEYDPAKARQLLAESKYGPQLENFDKPIILTTAGSFGSSIGLDLEGILQMWRENLGIDIEILRTEFATYLQDLVKRRFEMFEIGWIADYPDPENFLDLLFHSESNNNHTAYNNPEVDRLLVAARVEQDETSRLELYHQAEQLIMEDAPWIVLWYSGEQFVLVKPHVQDYKLTQLIIPKLRFVYLTEE